MRSILEALPHALLPDPARESDDPGVERERLDDDLVRPVAEEDLSLHASRGRKSPLARHVVHVVSPLDPALPLPIGLRLSVEGARVVEAHAVVGFTHQALERRAVGLMATDAALFHLVARAEPGTLAMLVVALALERLAGMSAPERARAVRGIAGDLLVVREALVTLAAPALRAGRLRRRALALVRDVDALLHGVLEGDTLSCVGGLRRDLHVEERTALARLLPALRRDFDKLDLDELHALRGVGVLPRDIARALAVDGPALRATGLHDDAPVDHETPAGVIGEAHQTGCTLARLRTRVADAAAALARVQDALRGLPDGPIAREIPHGALDGVAHAAVRGPSGSWSALVCVTGGRITRLRLRPPEVALIAAMPRALVGVPVDDVAAVIASFGLHASALDR